MVIESMLEAALEVTARRLARALLASAIESARPSVKQRPAMPLPSRTRIGLARPVSTSVGRFMYAWMAGVLNG